MIILKRIEIKNFRNIKEAVLDNCGDFNIIIGPPNCGKTNILNAINILTKLKWDERSSFHNYVDIRDVNLILDDNFRFAPLRCEGIDERDSYLRREAFRINFEFGDAYVEHLLRKTKKTTSEKILEALDFLLEYLEFLSKDLPSEIRVSKKNLEFGKRLDTLNIKNFFGSSLPLINVSPETFERIKNFFATIKNSMSEISLVQDTSSKNYALPDSLSLLYIKGIFDHIKVLLIEDKRIREYNNKSLKEHIKDKNMPSGEVAELVELIKKIGDPYLTDLTTGTFDFEKEIEIGKFQTPIEEQGSGIRSLICALGDIISLKEPSIILFDEPEIGLNPLAKQKLLEFLLHQSEDHQIFITTHDPTFVNPLFWKDKKPRVYVYLYSPYEEKFVKINIEENKEDPNTFAGYLPHTHSLKDIHIYVEGSNDVYIFQVFLKKYIERNINEKNKYKMINKVGIYHLGGDFWVHLLYTIPKQPYKCFVILDGDKKERAKEVIEKYNGIKLSKGFRFEFCEEVEDIARAVNENKYSDNTIVPVYCLKKDDIKKYLSPNDVSSNFNEKIVGPPEAEKSELPEEIERVFKAIFNQLIIFSSKEVEGTIVEFTSELIKKKKNNV